MRRAWAFHVLLVLLVCVTVALGDEVVGFSIDGPAAVIAPRGDAPPIEGRPLHAGRARAFVLLADSLRFQTATDPARMPALARIAAGGVRAKVTATRDAVTVPAIRAAFRGVERTALFGFVASLFRGKSRVRSIFTDLHAEGRRAVAYSDGSFLQFGDDLTERGNELPGASEIERQNSRALAAARELAAGEVDLAVVHLTYTDHVAHEVGVSHPRYRAHYRALDALIEELDRVIAPEDTLVVMGDHGHDEAGRHSMGLDVPTFALYRGPGFRAGVDLGTMAITDHRYLLAWALEVPVGAEYRGRVHPEALAARGELPAMFTRAPPAAEQPATVRAIAWAAGLALAAAAGAALLAVSRSALAAAPARRTYLGAALAGCAIALWGALLAWLRPEVHEPPYLAVAGAWIAAAIAIPIALRVTARGSEARAWAERAAVAIPIGALFLLYPTVYRYGAPGAMAPAWICGAIAIAAAAPGRRAWLAAFAIALLLFPFKLAEAIDFRFAGWISWPVRHLPGEWEALDAIALLVIFARRQRPIALALGLAAAFALREIHVGEIALGKLGAPVALALGAMALLLRASLRRGEARGAAPAELALIGEVERTVVLAALLLGFHATVVARVSTHAMLDLILAAVSLSAPLVERAPPRAARWAFAGLGLLAAFGAGWAGVAWTVHLFEWHVLYAWFDAATVEQHIGLFLPLILARYALPGLAARRLLHEGAPRTAAEASGHLFALSAAKAMSLALLMLGIGLVQATSDVYLEAAQEAAIWLVVMGGVIGRSGLDPRRGERAAA